MKKNISKILKYIINDSSYIYLTGVLKTKKLPNLQSPKTFYDKIQYLKINKEFKDYGKYVDKYDVREYVKEKIGEEYLVNLIGVYSNTNEINFESLPRQFVLKGTHGSGYNLIVKDKFQLDIEESIDLMDKWLKDNFYYKLREVQYKNIMPRIVCEEYLEDDSGELRDYKIFCSNGIAKFIQVDSSRYSSHKRDFYDHNWNKLDWLCEHESTNIVLNKPKKFEEMINLAQKLSEDFDFVRVDLYYVNDKIYFGELTFTPGAGVELYSPKEINNYVGTLITKI